MNTHSCFYINKIKYVYRARLIACGVLLQRLAGRSPRHFCSCNLCSFQGRKSDFQPQGLLSWGVAAVLFSLVIISLWLLQFTIMSIYNTSKNKKLKQHDGMHFSCHSKINARITHYNQNKMLLICMRYQLLQIL